MYTKAIIVSEKERKCGRQKEGGIYLKSGTDCSREGVLPKFVCIHPPVPDPGGFHRGTVLVHGDRILSRLPYDQWLAGSSLQRLEKNLGDADALNMFGMTAHTRLNTGECSGMDDICQAFNHLAGKATWNNRIGDMIRELTLLDVHNLPRAAADYAALVKACQDYLHTRRVDALLAITSATWRLADRIPPKKRQDVIPILMRILVLQSLSKDAVAMQQRYIANGDIEDAS